MRKNYYSQHISVPKTAIDIRGHVNNLIYLEWCLEAAENHWKQIATPHMLEHYVWYVLNHYIEYKASSFLGDTLCLETWIETIKGARSERHYKITRPSDNQVIINGKTTWCLLDAKTIKPARIPDECYALL